MKHLKLILLVTLLLSPNLNAKYDGIVLGASVGGNISDLKEKDASETIQQLGGNGKLYLGLGKSFLDTVFLGGELFMGYDFLADPDKASTTKLGNNFKWGAYLRAGARPSENFLIYGLFGFQNNTTSAFNSVKSLLTQKEGAWTSVVGAGVEYAISLGLAARIEGFYEIGKTIQFNELQDLTLNKNQLTINVGLVLYI